MPKVLVVTDPSMSSQVVIDRVKALPTEDFEIFLEHYLKPTSAKEAEAFVTTLHVEQEALAELAKPLLEAGYKVKCRVRVFDKLFETIINSAVELEVDYVFKPLRQHGTLRRMLYSATDWNLVRFCPCPLLLVNHKEHIHQRPVIAAIDLETKDKEHQALNVEVLAASDGIASLLGSEVHVVNAYNMMTLAKSDSTLDPLEYTVIKGMREEFFARAKVMAEEHGIPHDRVHLVEGAPEMAVNSQAETLDAGMIVLGTVARSGVSGFLVGNTAETIMESCESDVFVVKQPGFKTPIKISRNN